MQSIQARTLALIETELRSRKLDPAVAASYANTGSIYFYAASDATTPVGQIAYDFQSGTWKASITLRGRKIPSQPGRADYFDFYQRHDEPTAFWATLRATLDSAGFKVAKARKASNVGPVVLG